MNQDFELWKHLCIEINDVQKKIKQMGKRGYKIQEEYYDPYKLLKGKERTLIMSRDAVAKRLAHGA